MSATAHRAAPLCALALLSACRVGPNFHSPAAPAGAEAPLVSLDSRLESPAQPPDAWWRLYKDERLDQLVTQALSANRDLAAADANLSAARAVLSSVHAARYPQTQLSFGGVYGRDPTTEEILEIGGHAPQRLWLWEDIAQAAYEVDLFGQIHRAIEAASANADVVAAARDGTRVVVAAETARAYAAICAYGEQLRVAHQSLDIVSHESEITSKRYQAGAGAQLDVTRAQALVAQVQSSIPPLEGARQAALFELAALLGRTPTQAPRELQSCETPPQLTALMPIGDGRSLIRRRPDVRQAERHLAAATATIGVAVADLYPKITLIGFYGGAATAIPQLTSNLGRVWGVGPSISWNFPNQAGARAKVREAKASEAAALASFDSVVLTALKETEQALVTYRATLEQREALLQAQAQIHRSFDIASNEFSAGSLSQLDLLTTEQTLVAIDAAVASSDAALIQDQIGIFKALGGGWQATATAG
ncbi:MAG TPA: efflux transporter outer membrane subunit [Steroidobacteraceae bacterium]|nr:efflux transporter outer membrane subunit [Steroidobacteraceae bacterium]